VIYIVVTHVSLAAAEVILWVVVSVFTVRSVVTVPTAIAPAPLEVDINLSRAVVPHSIAITVIFAVIFALFCDIKLRFIPIIE
jgi:hypothetical protein